MPSNQGCRRTRCRPKALVYDSSFSLSLDAVSCPLASDPDRLQPASDPCPVGETGLGSWCNHRSPQASSRYCDVSTDCKTLRDHVPCRVVSIDRLIDEAGWATEIMLAMQHRQCGWTRSVVTLLAALAVAWALLSGASLASAPEDSCAGMQACCHHADGADGQAMHGAMKMDHPCDTDMNCPSPDCAMTSASIVAGTFESVHLTRPDLGPDVRSRAISSRPHSFALPIPKQPPKL